MNCSKCNGPMGFTQCTRVDFPNHWINLYSYKEYPKVEAKGIPMNHYQKCMLCGWRIPVMTDRYFIIQKLGEGDDKR